MNRFVILDNSKNQANEDQYNSWFNAAMVKKSINFSEIELNYKLNSGRRV